MAEAIISRRGYGADGKPELRTETITGNTNWQVPKYRSGDISVRIFGGGGAWGGAGGGYYGKGHYQSGGGYGDANNIGTGGYGAGGLNGGSGICIIQYYT